MGAAPLVIEGEVRQGETLGRSRTLMQTMKTRNACWVPVRLK